MIGTLNASHHSTNRAALREGLDVEGSGAMRGLIRDDADRASGEVAETGHHVRGVLGPQLEEASRVEDVVDDLPDVVRV